MVHPIFENITVNASGLLLSNELMGGITSALANNIDFALIDEESSKGVVFLNNKYMVSIGEGVSNFTVIKDKKALLNSVSLVVAFYRTFKPLSEILSLGQIDNLYKIAYNKNLIENA